MAAQSGGRVGLGETGMEVSGQPCKQRTQVPRHNNFDSKIMHLPFAYPMPGTPSPQKKNKHSKLLLRIVKLCCQCTLLHH